VQHRNWLYNQFTLHQQRGRKTVASGCIPNEFFGLLCRTMLITRAMVLLSLAALAAFGQTGDDPCQAYADVKGWIFSFSMQANGTAIDELKTTKYTIQHSGVVNAPIDTVRTESTIRGPNGEVYQAVFQGHSSSHAQVDDRTYYLDFPPAWKLDEVLQGAGGNDAAYDVNPNTFISFQPGLNSSCSSIVTFPDVNYPALYSSLEEKGWETIVEPFQWISAGFFQAGQTSILYGSATALLDWLPANSDPASTPPKITRNLTVSQTYAGGGPIIWNFQWTLEPIPGCGGTKPTITGPSEVWWFNGETPPNYDTEITLQATPASSCEHQWFIEEGDNLAAFSTQSTGPQIDLVSLGASLKQGDVKVRVRRNGVVSDPFPVTVRTPNSLDMLAPAINLKSEKYGYITAINFLILDQFKVRLTKDIPTSESWTSDVVADTSSFPSVSSSWFDRPPEKGGIAFGGIIEENVSGALIANSDPAPLWRPLDSAHKDKVVHWGRMVTVGSQTPGDGVPVQEDIVQLFQDHAEILDLNPANPK